MSNFDAIIIGAGVVGSSIALSLTRNGLRTLNIDRLPAAGYGSTSHSSAIIRPFYSHVTSTAIAHEARARWLEWSDYLGITKQSSIAEYRETGGLVLVRAGEESQFEKNLAALDAVGVDYQIMSGAEIERRHPGICLDAFGPPRNPADEKFGEPVPGRITSGIHIPAAGYVSDPQLAALNLASAAESLGAKFMFNAGVSAINQGPQGGITGVTTTNGEDLSAPIIINAAGPHSSKVNQLAGITLAIGTSAQRHEVAYSRATTGYLNQPEFIVDLDCGVYQRPDGPDMLIGSADPACDPPDVVDPDDFNPAFTTQWTTQMIRAAQRWPELGIENSARGTVGLYDVSSDWIPLYDRTDLPGYYIAIGTSGNQFKNAPVIGDIMAAIIDTPDHDSTPATLKLDHLKMTVDLSFYSRLRELQVTSSVMA